MRGCCYCGCMVPCLHALFVVGGSTAGLTPTPKQASVVGPDGIVGPSSRLRCARPRGCSLPPLPHWLRSAAPAPLVARCGPAPAPLLKRHAVSGALTSTPNPPPSPVLPVHSAPWCALLHCRSPEDLGDDDVLVAQYPALVPGRVRTPLNAGGSAAPSSAASMGGTGTSGAGVGDSYTGGGAPAFDPPVAAEKDELKGSPMMDVSLGGDSPAH